jgi:acyl carrier protein
MPPVEPKDVRAVVATYVSRLSGQGSAKANGDFADDFDLYLSGSIDSLALLGLVAAIQEAFGDHIDFDDMDPEDMTIVGPLCRFVAERANAA